MKIRIKGNSIRIRLSRSEVAHFSKEGYLEEKTEFIDNTLIYVLQYSTEYHHLAATFTDNVITIYAPENISNEWTTTDTVGFEHNMDTGEGRHLFLLIEKDFKCIDNTTEDQSDNYEHPNLSCT